jgi:hypothetical protein
MGAIFSTLSLKHPSAFPQSFEETESVTAWGLYGVCTVLYYNRWEQVFG